MAKPDASADSGALPRDYLTVLGCSPKLVLTKTFDGDQKTDFDEVRNYRPRAVGVSSLSDLYRELDVLSRNPHACVIRGRYVGDDEAQRVCPPERPGQVRRVLSLFKDTPRSWAMFDVDGRPSDLIDWHSRESVERAVLEFVRAALPREFFGVSFVFHASASAGRNPARLSGHLWFWLGTPTTSEALRAWVRSTRTPVDAAVFNPVQVHYTAAPIFKGGALDPVGADCRLILVDGVTDVLDLKISPEILLASADRIAEANSKTMPDPTTKPGLIGAFCRAYDIPTVLDEWIPGVFAADDPVRPRRLTFLESASGMPGGAFITDDGHHVVNKHNGDPFENRAANAFDLVRVYRFGHLDIDAAKDTRVADLPSHAAMLELIAKDEKTRGEAAAAQAAAFLDDLPDLPPNDTPGAGTEPPVRDADDPLAGLVDDPAPVGRTVKAAPNWIKSLALDQDGNIVANLANGKAIAVHALGEYVHFNALKLRIEAHARLPWRRTDPRDGFGPEWRDSDDVHARIWIAEKFGVKFSAAMWAEIMATIEVDLARHPVREYLSGLTWDGVDRISRALSRYLGVEQSLYSAELFAVWLRAAVARVFIPGIKFDLMPILVGDQGTGKSTFLRILAVRDEWFLDNPPELNRNKDAKEAVAGFWWVEFAEMAAMTRAEAEAVKTFVSSQSDDYRPAYGRRTIKVLRQGVFAGTTNSETSLRDETGNRRFPVIETGRTDLAALRRDVDQLWAQAVADFKAREAIGAPLALFLSSEASATAEAIADEHLDDGDLSGALAEFLTRPVPEGHYARDAGDLGFVDPAESTAPRDGVSVVEVAVEVLGLDLSRISPATRGNIRRALRKIPGVSKTSPKKRQGRRYGVQRVYSVDVDAVRAWSERLREGGK